MLCAGMGIKRDGVVLPLLLQGGVYVVKLVLSKTVSQTTAA